MRQRGVDGAGGCDHRRRRRDPEEGRHLKFVVPDEPPSFDGHRETTFALIHPIAPFYSVLIRVNPDNPASTDRFRLRLVHRDAQAGRWRQDLHLQDPQGRQVPRRLGADRQRRATPRSSASFSRRRACRARARPNSTMVESVTAPDDETVVFKLKYPSGAFMPVARLALSLHLLQGDPRQGPALVREERDGLGPVRVRGARGRRGRHAASATPTTITPACPISMASRRSSPRRSRCACRRSAATRRPWSSAACRRRAAMISLPRSARTSRSRKATGTAC